jgi:hypothetical protein
VLPFNFSHTGAGPLMSLMQYHRLRREGIRPDWLVLEVMPPAIVEEHPQMLRDCMTADDYPVLSRHLNPGYLGCRYALSRLPLWYQHRDRLLESTAAEWADRDALSASALQFAPLGGDQKYAPNQVTPERRSRGLAMAHKQYFDSMQQFEVSPQSDGAERELLGLCRADGVRVALLLTPEGSEFRSWYGPGADGRLLEWCASVSRDSGAPLIDGRRWLGDDCFYDSHHVVTHGAEAFTRRLEAEVLRPLVDDRLSRP